MMYIFVEDAIPFTWHVGENKTPLSRAAGAAVEVQADGDELDHVLSKCRNLPLTTATVQRWFGDHAKFIVGNL